MEKAIFTNMCMIYDGDRVLVQDRKNSNWQGIAFPGGHVEPEESFVRSTVREVKEETGLDIWNLQLCGVKQFTNREKDYRYVVFLYKTNCFSGELKSSEEGEIFWIDRKDLLQYKMANKFEEMLEIFENDGLTEHFYWQEAVGGEWKMENL